MASNLTRSACGPSLARAAGSSQRPALVARPSGLALRQGGRPVVAVRIFGGGDGQQQQDKKFLSRDEEPEEYWSSKGERAGANPLADPLAIIGIIAIFFPFIFLLIAIATGYVDISVYK